MEPTLAGLTIGTFAQEAGVSVETVRFYQRRGLLSEPEKSYGSIRRYGPADIARVRFVKAAQRLGFSLDEVAGLLTLDDGVQCDDARQFAELKLADVRGPYPAEAQAAYAPPHTLPQTVHAYLVGASRHSKGTDHARSTELADSIRGSGMAFVVESRAHQGALGEDAPADRRRRARF